MARLTKETKHIVIGTAAILTIAVLFALGYNDDPKKFDGDGYRLYATYETATGLTPGSPVVIAGIPVGAVRQMLLLRDTNEVQVEMRIKDGVKIPVDSEALIISNGIAGGKYVRISAGGDLESLKPDEHFDYTRGAIDFLDLFEKIVVTAEKRHENAKDGSN